VVLGVEMGERRILWGAQQEESEYEVPVHKSKTTPASEPDPIVLFPHDLAGVTDLNMPAWDQPEKDDSPGGEIRVTGLR
jgi:hypothetical protein